MNTAKTGQLIAAKRKEAGLTQEKLAEKIGVTNKTVSKWETGKCMPDYSVVPSLCEELNISAGELISGKESEDKSDSQLLEALERIQKLEKEKTLLSGLVLIIMGMVLSALSQLTVGSDFKDFLSGVMMGLSIGIMLIGMYTVGKTFRK